MQTLKLRTVAVAMLIAFSPSCAVQGRDGVGSQHQANVSEFDPYRRSHDTVLDLVLWRACANMFEKRCMEDPLCANPHPLITAWQVHGWCESTLTTGNLPLLAGTTGSNNYTVLAGALAALMGLAVVANPSFRQVRENAALALADTVTQVGARIEAYRQQFTEDHLSYHVIARIAVLASAAQEGALPAPTDQLADAEAIFDPDNPRDSAQALWDATRRGEPPFDELPGLVEELDALIAIRDSEGTRTRWQSLLERLGLREPPIPAEEADALAKRAAEEIALRLNELRREKSAWQALSAEEKEAAENMSWAFGGRTYAREPDIEAVENALQEASPAARDEVLAAVEALEETIWDTAQRLHDAHYKGTGGTLTMLDYMEVQAINMGELRYALKNRK